MNLTQDGWCPGRDSNWNLPNTILEGYPYTNLFGVLLFSKAARYEHYPKPDESSQHPHTHLGFVLITCIYGRRQGDENYAPIPLEFWETN
jgi:hypothetical protein